jgi:hypothetical protein
MTNKQLLKLIDKLREAIEVMQFIINDMEGMPDPVLVTKLEKIADEVEEMKNADRTATTSRTS